MLTGRAARAAPLPASSRARQVVAASLDERPRSTFSGQADRPRLASLALAATTAAGLLLGSAFGPLSPPLAHAEAPPPPTALTAGPATPAGLFGLGRSRPETRPETRPEGAESGEGGSGSGAANGGNGAAVGRPEPLNRNADPMTMQLPEAPSDLAPEEVRAIRLFARNTPSVVNVTNLRAVPSYGGAYSYWGRQTAPADAQRVPAGFGSGFIWDDKGHVVTNFHVIKGADEVRVTLLDGTTHAAAVVGGDADKDVAVLALKGLAGERVQQLQPVTLGSSGALLVGQRVFAIGNPLGLEHTLTSGIVSGLNRELSNGSYTIRGLIQTDAAINPGNSGGVLLDSAGRVVGINTAIADPTGKGASSGVGFALPIDAVRGLVEQILQYGRVLRPVLGVTLAPPQVLKQLGQQGVLVLEVPAGSPASRAGLKGTYRDPLTGSLVLGDIITALDGKAVRGYGDLLEALDARRVGDTVQVEVLRSQTDNLFRSGEARKVAVAVTLGERGQLSPAE